MPPTNVDNQEPGMLAAMFAYQSEFMAKEIKRLHPEGFDLTQMHHSLCSHLISEGQELMDCEPWYFHKKPAAATRYTMITEMVDVWKWLMNLMHVHQVTPQEFVSVFCEKSTVVESRILAETFARSKPGPILVIDLDGVLIDRDSALMSYCHNTCGTRTQHCKTPKDVRLCVGGQAYAKLKTGFYQSKFFDWCKPMVPAIEALNTAKAAGVGVLILTARPVKKHARLHFQTIKWLHEHGVQYQALVCMEEKGKALESWCDPSSIFLDDEQANIDDVAPICTSRLYTGAQMISDAIEELKKCRSTIQSQSGRAPS